MNLLIVDDEQIFIDTIIRKVDWAKYGFFCIYTAVCIMDGMRIMHSHEIHLLLCDIEMPQGNGLEMFEQVKLYYPRTECIFVTCHDDYHYLRRALQLGSFDYVLKPVDYKEFELSIETVVSRIKCAYLEHKHQEKLSNYDNRIVNNNEYVEKIIYYIRQHISEPISITDISAAVHLNSQYAMRLFKKHMNQSILTYITEQRIKIASELLCDTDIPIARVSSMVGINNPSYFIKLFKKNTGKTPGEFRDYNKNASGHNAANLI